MTEDSRRASEPADALFAYGTLQFPEVLTALLGRVPEHGPAEAPGWRAAALGRRLYPGLIPDADRSAPGVLLTGLTPAEWRILDAFEADEYELRSVRLADGREVPSYVWRGGEELRETWDATRFRTAYLADFLAREGLPSC
ncbi:gamma-glutamylcyclotransferase [Streptomyces sp. LX-29]|uniref:gamma-glutamylcyclotransferase family protein n=1 Tax=Streptomyces sp. LX-29 TaxID=2900152 RepID=UPI00240D36D2|nr:gamma-glutamylcyclotransferase family protein [Streptomyces sp. LX-29]WFB10903.1 gamma-glutamylcyclotransferase [Streptomyces sp. LX-29]